jgi:hypothetical protein
MMIERANGLARPGGWLTLLLLTLPGCSTADGDTAGSTVRSTEEAASPATSDQATERPSPPACLPAVGSLEADASLEGRTGEYLLTMVEKSDTIQPRSEEGSLTLLPQSEDLRQFRGSAGASIPGVDSPLYGSTDIRVEGVGAVRVGDLSSLDTAAPGVLVIESRTGVGPTILLRFGSDANRRELVRFDGGFTVLSVDEITDEAFLGTWSSGTRGPASGGFFCARLSG